MSVDLSKLTLYTPDNAFKNVNRYTGSLTFPTSLTAGQTGTVSLTIPLTDTPVFTELFANFLELAEAISLYVFAAGTTPKRWYSGNESGGFGIGLHISAPAPNVGWINGGISTSINGSNVTVTGTVINPYGVTITIDSVTVSFVFVEYTLAS